MFDALFNLRLCGDADSKNRERRTVVMAVGIQGTKSTSLSGNMQAAAIDARAPAIALDDSTS
jgi:hypothetical protein